MSDPTTMPSTTPTAPPTALGRPFWTVWAGQTVSMLGSTLAGVGVAVYVYAATGSVGWLGVLLAVSALPSLVVAPALGIVDRVERRTAMITADLVAASGTAIVLVIASLGQLEIWHLAVAGFVAGLGTAMQVPAYQAAIPALVPRAALGRANGLVQLAPATAIVVGPALATTLLVAGGIELILAIDVLSCLVGVGATAATRFSSRPVVSSDRERVPGGRRSGGSLAGWRWLRTTGRPLLRLLAVVATVNLALAMFNVSLLAMATDVGGPGRAGLVPALGGLGMVAASLVVARTGVPTRRVRAIALALAGVAAGIAVSGLRPWFWVLVLGVALAMTAVPIANAAAATLFHEHVPEQLHGRVFGFRAAIARGLEPLGALAGGLVVSNAAGPLVGADGILGGVTQRLVGSGPARDAALVALAVGITVGVTAVCVGRSRVMRSLDAPAVAATTPAVDVAAPARRAGVAVGG